MKTLIVGLAILSTFTSSVTFAGSNKELVTSDIRTVLPEQVQAIDSPAPEKVKPTRRDTQYTAEQKASIVELSLETQKKQK